MGILGQKQDFSGDLLSLLCFEIILLLNSYKCLNPRVISKWGKLNLTQVFRRQVKQEVLRSLDARLWKAVQIRKPEWAQHFQFPNSPCDSSSGQAHQTPDQRSCSVLSLDLKICGVNKLLFFFIKLVSSYILLQR